MSNPKRILIIGAGPSGLVAAKEAIDNGLDPIIFEKTSDIGGIWNPETGAVWPSMQTNLSKFSCSFTGFPFSDQTDMFPSSLEMYKYLLQYSNHFKVHPRIHFNHTVLNVKTTEEGWQVNWSEKDKAQKVGIFHAVLICTGIFSCPYIPNIEGLESFPGKVIHAKDYKDGSAFLRKSVLVIGGSLSAEQIASDVSKYANRVIHTFKKRFWLLDSCIPLDPSNPKSKALPMDLVSYNRKFYNPNNAAFSKNNYMGSVCYAQQAFPQLRISEEDLSNSIYVTITSGANNYLGSVEKGIIIPKRGVIQKFESSTVVFKNGDKLEAENVVFATGFKVDVPFLSEKILNTLKFEQNDQLQPLILFNDTLHPELPNLFFVGMYKGPFFAVMELQARWACRLLSGKVSLPPKEIIMKGLQSSMRIREQVPRGQFPHPDYVRYADEIAGLAGSLPNFEKLKTLGLLESLAPNVDSTGLDKDEIYEKFMTSPVVPEHYNLFENPKSALVEINKVIDVMKCQNK